MTQSKRVMLFVPLVSIFAALSLAALAQEPPKKPEQKGPAVQQRGPVKPAPQINRQTQRPGAPGAIANRAPHFDHDASHWSDRDRRAWSGGHWRHECRFGRCAYWWWADGYWYWYDQPTEGPPAVVSDVEYADAPVAEGAPPPPGAAYAPPPPPPPPAPPPGQEAVGGAIGGAVIGGILGGLLTGRPGGAAVGAIVGGTTGAAIGAQAEARHGYYLWQGNCYYRYPTGEYSVIDPRYCY